MSRGDGQTIWPAYFDYRLSRKQGRRVAKRRLPEDVITLEDLQGAAEELGLEHTVIKDAFYPRQWYATPGKLYIRSAEPKTKVIVALAKAMVE